MDINTRNPGSISPRLIILSLACSLVLLSCTKNPIREIKPPDPPPGDSVNYAMGYYIVNEGNFNWGNASVTFIDTSGGPVVQNLFETANSRALGDVAQNMKVFNNRGYIVVNNSNRVEVVSLETFKSVKTITGLNSPRYIEFIDSSKAYVTNMKHDIDIIDLNTLTVTGTIPTAEWTESMIRYQDYVFVTCLGKFSETVAERRAKVLIISTKEDKIVDSIQTGKDPVGIAIDKKQKVWVLSTGGWNGFEPPSLVRIDPGLRTIEKAFVFGSGSPSRLCINPSGDTLYFLDGGIFQMSVTSAALPAVPLVQAEGHLFYGLDINPVDGTIWATDAVDYVQNGRVYQFSSSTGSQLHLFKAGPIPSTVCFGATGITSKKK